MDGLRSFVKRCNLENILEFERSVHAWGRGSNYVHLTDEQQYEIETPSPKKSVPPIPENARASGASKEDIVSEYPFDRNFMPNNLQNIKTPDEPIACPIGLALWEEYRRRNPQGLKTPPQSPEDHPDPEPVAYFGHVDSCDDCNEV
jgi:hypothetical protein